MPIILVTRSRRVWVTQANAFHSSSNQGRYVGMSCRVVINMGDITFYHAGDTDHFSDMKQIGQIYKPEFAAIPIWRSEKPGFTGKIPAHLEWVTGEQSWTLIEIMNSRNNINEKIEELKYAAECLEDLINDWEKKTITLG